MKASFTSHRANSARKFDFRPEQNIAYGGTNNRKKCDFYDAEWNET